MKKYILLSILLLLFGSSFAQQRIYVRQSASGAADGTSWSNAFTDLQLALQSAGYGDTMWVAAGTYRPTTDDNRDSSFQVPNGLRLYGGFAGTETALDQRDYLENPVVLSGEIGDPTDTTDNSYTIMYLAYPDSFTVVDGFTFRFGYAEPVPLFFQDGTEPFICGGAMYIQGFAGAAYPDIRHCTFEYNYAWSAGGAVYVNGKGEDASVAPRFLDCTFRHNRTTGYGGGLYRYGGSWAERYPDFGDCLFEKNFAAQWGGGLYYYDTERTDTLHFSGCSFIANEGEQDAGAMGLSMGRIAGASLMIRNCRFDRNFTPFGMSSGIRQNLTSLLLDNVIISNTRFSNQNKKTINLLGEASEEYSIRQMDGCRFDSIQNSFNLESRNTVKLNNCHINAFNGNIGTYVSPGLETNIEVENNVVEKSDFTFQIQIREAGVHISNNIFKNNSNSQNFFRLQSNIFQPAPVIRNSTFINNGGMPQNFQAPGYDLDVIYQNCLFYGNKIDTILSSNYTGHVFFNHCYFDEFGCNNQIKYAVCDAGTIIGGDPGFVDTALGDYRLSACSMLRDAGNNTGLGDVPTDVAGNPRIQDGQVDIGAYEVPGFAFSSPVTTTALCDESPTGSIALQTTDGCEPYTVSWQNGAQSGTGLSELPAGTYFLSVTDQGGRLLRDTVQVLQGGFPEVDNMVQPVVCGATTGGSATLVASGGLLPYTFLWSDGSTDEFRTGLVTGVYQATVSDAAGCTTMAEAVVGLSGHLNLSADVSQISCFGLEDGTLSVSALNGLAPYNYNWSQGPHGPELSDLGPGLYYATVTDALGCSGVYLFNLTEPALLTAAVDSMAASGPAMADGSLSAAGQGGSGPYLYEWSSGDDTPVADMLLPGSYELTLTDQHGCLFTGTYSVPYTIGTQETGAGASAFLYPNPAVQSTTLYLRGWPAGTSVVDCFDATGKQVFHRPITLSGGTEQIAIPLNGMPDGVYQVLLHSANGIRAWKLVVLGR